MAKKKATKTKATAVVGSMTDVDVVGAESVGFNSVRVHLSNNMEVDLVVDGRGVVQNGRDRAVVLAALQRAVQTRLPNAASSAA